MRRTPAAPRSVAARLRRLTLPRRAAPRAQNNVAAACSAAAALGAPRLLRNVDEWLAAQEDEAKTGAGGGVMGAFNSDNIFFERHNYDTFSSSWKRAQRAADTANDTVQRYADAMALAKRYGLRCFGAALAGSLRRAPQGNARELLALVTAHALRETATTMSDDNNTLPNR